MEKDISVNKMKFAQKLQHILDPDNVESRAIISWVGDGNGFFIHDYDAFKQKILPQYFRHAKLKSFQRQLNLYGFWCKTYRNNSFLIKIYQHKIFHRDRPEASAEIKRSYNCRMPKGEANDENGDDCEEPGEDANCSSSNDEISKDHEKTGAVNDDENGNDNDNDSDVDSDNDNTGGSDSTSVNNHTSDKDNANDNNVKNIDIDVNVDHDKNENANDDNENSNENVNSKNCNENKNDIQVQIKCDKVKGKGKGNDNSNGKARTNGNDRDDENIYKNSDTGGGYNENHRLPSMPSVKSEACKPDDQTSANKRLATKRTFSELLSSLERPSASAPAALCEEELMNRLSRDDGMLFNQLSNFARQKLDSQSHTRASDASMPSSQSQLKEKLGEKNPIHFPPCNEKAATKPNGEQNITGALDCIDTSALELFMRFKKTQNHQKVTPRLLEFCEEEIFTYKQALKARHYGNIEESMAAKNKINNIFGKGRRPSATMTDFLSKDNRTQTLFHSLSYPQNQTQYLNTKKQKLSYLSDKSGVGYSPKTFCDPELFPAFSSSYQGIQMEGRNEINPKLDTGGLSRRLYEDFAYLSEKNRVMKVCEEMEQYYGEKENNDTQAMKSLIKRYYQQGSDFPRKGDLHHPIIPLPTEGPFAIRHISSKSSVDSHPYLHRNSMESTLTSSATSSASNHPYLRMAGMDDSMRTSSGTSSASSHPYLHMAGMDNACTSSSSSSANHSMGPPPQNQRTSSTASTTGSHPYLRMTGMNDARRSSSSSSAPHSMGLPPQKFSLEHKITEALAGANNQSFLNNGAASSAENLSLASYRAKIIMDAMKQCLKNDPSHG